MRLEFHPAVQTDFNRAFEYYEIAAGPHLGDRFEGEFRACLAAIQAAPRQFAFYGTGELFRRIRLETFPYVVVYRETVGAVRVTILKHERRHLAFGMGRW
jgi:plasmid stabilization system protein ParE